MNYSPKLKWLLLPLIILSLGWKSTVRLEYSSTLEQDIFDQLASDGFIVTVSEELVRDKRTLRATKGNCLMRVTPIGHRGWESDALSKSARPGDQVFIVFRGTIYDKHPTWLTAADFLLYKFLSELGLSNIRPSPIIGVVANRSCEAKNMPWSKFSSTRPASK